MSEPVTLRIEDLAGQGDGVATYEGRPVFVPYTVTNDVARISITERKDVLHGNVIELIEAGPDRAKPPCAHFGRCGGCAVQHVSNTAYQSWKEKSVHHLFSKAGLEPRQWLPPVFIPSATRRRVTFAVHKRGKDILLGFNAAGSDELIDVSSCLLLTPALDSMRSRIKPYLHGLLPEGKATDLSLQDVDGAIELILTGDFKDLSFQKIGLISEMGHELGLARIGWRPKPFAAAEMLLEPGPVKKTFGKLQVDIPAGAFLQPSQEGENALVAAVLDACKGMKNKKFADLYSGCGTFAGHLLAQGSVYAAESDAQAIAVLRKAAAGMPQKLSVEKRDLGKEPLTKTELRNFDCVVFDPPRAGAREQAEIMGQSKTPLIIGVSCNPVTFIRDAGALVKGGYVFESLRLIDQFIWSAHSEVVGVFRKSD